MDNSRKYVRPPPSVTPTPRPGMALEHVDYFSTVGLILLILGISGIIFVAGFLRGSDLNALH